MAQANTGKREKRLVYQVKVMGKPGHGGRASTWEDAQKLRDALLKTYPNVRIFPKYR